MTRSILYGVLALTSVVAVGTIPVACQSGGVGDPCTPEEEYQSNFAGFAANQNFIESSSFDCSTRLCLVNYFQGRVSCPLGQVVAAAGSTTQAGSIQYCTGPGDQSCVASQVPTDPNNKPVCTQAENYGPACKQNSDCLSPTTCDLTLGICTCDPTGVVYPTQINGVTEYYCDNYDPVTNKTAAAYTLKTYVCHTRQTAAGNDCQQEYLTGKQTNAGKQCCVPGTDTPVSVTVCPQCSGTRSAQNAVYCSCRCLGPTDTVDTNFNYCTCPSGFTCTELRSNIGLGDPELAGSYCIMTGTAYDPSQTGSECGAAGFQSKDDAAAFTGAGCGGS
jgi:hypothetical protein